MHKILMAIAATAALFTLAACGPNNESSEATPPATEAPATEAPATDAPATDGQEPPASQ